MNHKLTDEEMSTMYDADKPQEAVPVTGTAVIPKNTTKEENQTTYFLAKIRSLESTVSTLQQKTRDQATRISNLEQQVRQISRKLP